jgi:hypothetical protein
LWTVEIAIKGPDFMKRTLIFHSNLGHWRWIGWLRTSRCGRWQRLGQSAPEIRGLGYGALGARLGSEKRSGRGRRSHLGVGGCGEAAARPSIGKHLRWLLILDEDGASVLLWSKHGVRKIQSAPVVLLGLVEGLRWLRFGAASTAA